jgi:hypothetical protein
MLKESRLTKSFLNKCARAVNRAPQVTQFLDIQGPRA